MSMWTEDRRPPEFFSGGDGEEQDQEQDDGGDGGEDERRYRQRRRHHHQQHQQQDYRSSTVMALGNSCFGSLEHPRELPARVHMASSVESREPARLVLAASASASI